MSLETIVNVQISKETATVSRVGFGVPLILTFHTKDPARVLEFSKASDMLVAAGGPFADTDQAFVLANAAFAQDPRPDRILVGRRVFPTIRTVTITPRSGVISGQTFPLPTTLYRIIIDGVNFDFTTDATPTEVEISLALTTAINAGAVDVLATDNIGSITIEKADTPGGTATAGVAFTIAQDRALLEIEDVTPVATGGGLASEIAAIIDLNDDWYGIAGDWYGKTEIDAVATAIEALPKLHATSTPDDNTYDPAVTTDVGSVLQGKAFARTFLTHHVTPDTGIAAARLGDGLPKDPGSATWKFQLLAAIPVVDYTTGEKTALKNKNIERFIRVAGVNFTCDGKTSSGEFIDITRFIDFLTSRMQENVFLRVVNVDKVAFTNPGIGIIENEVRGTLNLGISVGGLAADPPFTVTVPNAIVGTPNGVDAVDKANRLLKGVEFCATLAGAIHEIEIRGEVTV